jgi:hypothetical protein
LLLLVVVRAVNEMEVMPQAGRLLLALAAQEALAGDVLLIREVAGVQVDTLGPAVMALMAGLLTQRLVQAAAEGAGKEG